MKQSTLIFLVILSLLITLLTACVEDQSKHGRKLMSKKANQGPLVNSSIRSDLGLEATLLVTDYEKGGDSGGPAECDGVYHSNDMFLVSLSTTWYNGGKNCNRGVNISYKGKDIIAAVIDECDSSDGCSDDDVAASNAVWRALQVPESEWGEIKVIWSYVN